MKISLEQDAYRQVIKILYKDYDVTSSNFKTKIFDLNKVDYYDDLMFGEKFLGRLFNEYLDFDVLDYKTIHIHTNYPMFIINIRKLKIKKLLKTIK